MYERFTERARQVVICAQDEARRLKHNYIGTEHVLLGLVREGEGVAYRILEDLGADAETVRAEVIRLLSGPRTKEEPPPTPVADLAIRVADRIADRLIEELRKWAQKT